MRKYTQNRVFFSKQGPHLKYHLYNSHYFFRWNEKVAAGQSRPKSAPAFRPRFCFLDKKVLRFYAYFEEHAGLDDRAPEKRIREVQILYHLEDDSISILEPRIQVLLST